MSNDGQDIDFSVDKNNLYREESITDLKVASIRKLVPINADGSEDDTRKSIFYGHTQLMSPQGPIPIQSSLEADNLDAAMEEFPSAMKVAMEKVLENFRKMQQQEQEKNDSRIITPGR